MHKLRNREARIFTYSNYYLDAGHLFKLLGWKNLTSQQQFQRATTVYKSLQELTPEYLGSKFERQEAAYNIRDSDKSKYSIAAHKLLYNSLI